MSAGTEPAGWPQPRTSSEDATHAWLDALAGGICTPETFLGAMREQFQGDRDDGWEVLSLLDQYYRRGKIKAELFHSLKSRLEGSALGDQEVIPDARPNAPPPVPPPPSATATTETLTVVPTVTPTSVTAPAAAPVAATPGKASTASRRALREVRREVAIGDVLRGRYRIRGVF